MHITTHNKSFEFENYIIKSSPVKLTVDFLQTFCFNLTERKKFQEHARELHVFCIQSEGNSTEQLQLRPTDHMRSLARIDREFDKLMIYVCHTNVFTYLQVILSYQLRFTYCVIVSSYVRP